MQTALNNQAAMRIIPPTSNDENVPLNRPPETSAPYSRAIPIAELADRLYTKAIPGGYTSQPMSRDTSRESNASMATAPPAVPGSASLSTSPQIREPYLYSRPGLASIDVVAASSWDSAAGSEGAFAELEANTTSPLVSGMLIEAVGSGAGPLVLPRAHPQGSVQFGQMSPVEFAGARTRVSLARERSFDALTGLGTATGKENRR